MDILDYVCSFIPLINSHSNDFLTDDLYKNFVPHQIRSFLTSIDNPKYILDKYIKYSNKVALFENLVVNENCNWSMLIDPTKKVVDRKIFPKWEIVDYDLENFIKNCSNFSNFKLFTNAKNEFFDSVFIDHEMNAKKSYEVEKMSCLCRTICSKYNIENVVDIGSGKGYLGADLSISNGLNVVELDSKESNKTGAFHRRQRFKSQVPSMKKKKNLSHNTKVGDCLSVVRTITPSDTISKILSDEGYIISNYLITGLHCCGGLSSTILKNFVFSTDAKALVLVGCCYHLLNEKFVKNFHADENEFSDFPLSNQFQKSGIILGRNAKTFASQSVRRILADRDLHPSMFHRILLQKLLKDKLGYVSDDWIVGKISKKMSNENNFEEYVQLSCQKLGFSDIINKMSGEEIMSYEIKYPNLRHEFTCFFYLKCCLSAVIENIIIWDRWLYLRENGIDNVEVLELFDELNSPRRYALVGIK